MCVWGGRGFKRQARRHRQDRLAARGTGRERRVSLGRASVEFAVLVRSSGCALEPRGYLDEAPEKTQGVGVSAAQTGLRALVWFKRFSLSTRASWRSAKHASRRRCQRWWQGSRPRRVGSWRQGHLAHLELFRIFGDLERGNTKGWMVGCTRQGLCVHRSARRRRRTALTSG